MPELPKVTQEFDADNSGFMTALQAMIDQCDRLAKSIQDDITKIGELQSAINSLDGKTIKINIVTVGNVPDIQNQTVTQYVKRIFVGGNDQPGNVTSNVSENIVIPQQDIDRIHEAAYGLDQLGKAIVDTGNEMSVLNTKTNDLVDTSAKMETINQDIADSYKMLAYGLNVQANANNTLKESDKALAAATASMGDESSKTGLTLLAYSDAAKKAGLSVGAMMIPLGLAAFGITGLATGLHLAVMGTFEFLAVFIPAMYALAAGAAVAAQGAQLVYTHLSSVYTAAEALGPMVGQTAGQVLGLGNNLQKAQDMANPGVYELLGAAIRGVQEAMGGLNQNGLSPFNQLGLDVVHMLDQFGAKLDVDIAQNMGKIQGLVSNAASDLKDFGQILGNVGHAILNLAAAMPGLAEIVLKVVDGFTALVKWVSNLPAPFLTAILVIEEMYRWSGLLAGGFGLLGRGIALLGTLGLPVIAKIGSNFGLMAANVLSGIAGMITNFGALVSKMTGGEGAIAIDGALARVARGFEGVAGFLGGPWGAAIAVAAIGITALVLLFGRAKDAIAQFDDSLLKAVSQASNVNVLNVIGSSMAQIAVKTTQTTSSLNAMNAAFAKGTSAWTTMAGQAAQAGSDLQNLSATQHQLIDTQLQVITGAGNISREYGVGFASALGIADMAGVNLSKTIVVFGKNANAAGIQIENMYLGFEKMNQTGSTLANTMSAINVQAGIQASKVSQVNQAWDQFLAMATGLTGSFTQLQLDMQQMGNQATTVGTKIQAFSGSTQLSIQQIASALKNFSGGNAQIWQSWGQSLQGAESYLDQLRTASVAGAVTNKEYQQSVAYVVQQLLPYAAQSKVATAQLSVLAQEAGGPATSSFSTLKSWVDKNTVSSQTFTGMLDQMTIKLTNVTQVAKNFAGTLQSDVTAAMAAGAVSTLHLTQLSANYASALETTGKASNQTMAAQGALDDTLKRLGYTQTEINNINSIMQNEYAKSTTATNDNKQATSANADVQNSFATNTLPQTRNAIDSVKNHTDIFSHALDPDLTGALTNVQGSMDTTSSVMDTFRDSHMNPAQLEIQRITDAISGGGGFSLSLHPNLTGALDQAGNHADSLRTRNIDPLNQHVGNTRDTTKDLGTKLHNLPPNTQVNINETGKGTFSVSGIPSGLGIAGTAIKLASGGFVPGYSPGHDTVPAMLSPGEGILTPQAARMLGGEHGINAFNRYAQHFAGGGYVSPFAGWSPNPERIDQGVDFSGSGPIRAIGQARIVETGGGGWPGGPYMSYELLSGPDAGRFIYVAENIIPDVHPGQIVNAGSVIATMFNGGTGIEMGWAASGGASPLSQTAAAGGISGGNLPPDSVTAVGANFDQFLISLGVAHAPNFGQPASGKLPAGMGSGGIGAGTGLASFTYPVPNWSMTPFNSKNNFFRGIGNWTNQAVGTSMAEYAGAIGKGLANELSALKTANAQMQAGLAGVPGGVTSGSEMQNLLTIARYLMSQGATAAAAAGIASVIAGESAGDPESVGSGGFGLIGWTGNTLGLPGGFRPTGNASRDLAIEMAGIIGYGRAVNAGMFAQLLRSTDYNFAADEWSSAFEKPARALSDTRPGIAAQLYALLASSASPTAASNLITHAATHDAGGYIYPGVNFIRNNTGRIERTVGPNEPGAGGIAQVSVNIDGKRVFEALQPYVYQYNSRNSGNGNINGTWRPR